MAKFIINEGYASGVELVEANYFATNGEFVDFYDDNDRVVFRVKASSVQTIKRTPE